VKKLQNAKILTIINTKSTSRPERNLSGNVYDNGTYQLQPGLVASYDLWPENGTGLFWKK